MNTLYFDCLCYGLTIDHYRSDLYIKDSEFARKLIKRHGVSAISFIDNIDGTIWFDVAFEYDPFWNNNV